MIYLKEYKAKYVKRYNRRMKPWRQEEEDAMLAKILEEEQWLDETDRSSQSDEEEEFSFGNADNEIIQHDAHVSPRIGDVVDEADLERQAIEVSKQLKKNFIAQKLAIATKYFRLA